MEIYENKGFKTLNGFTAYLCGKLYFNAMSLRCIFTAKNEPVVKHYKKPFSLKNQNGNTEEIIRPMSNTCPRICDQHGNCTTPLRGEYKEIWPHLVILLMVK